MIERIINILIIASRHARSLVAIVLDHLKDPYIPRKVVLHRMSSNSNTPPEDYFNDLSNPEPNKRRRSPVIHDEMGTDRPSGEHDNGVPRLKRIACVICRKRKLKCDGSKPSCSTCTRLNHNCAYDEVRRKSGPKRGYVKALEARLS